jgi:hypothetical protein
MLWRSKPDTTEVIVRRLGDELRREVEQLVSISDEARAAELVLDGLGQELNCIRRLIHGERQ